MLVNNQQSHGEIGVFYNKLCGIKYYYNFLDFQKSYPATIFDFGSPLMVLNLLASFYFESAAYYIVIILQLIRGVNVYSLTFSYIFHAFYFKSPLSIQILSTSLLYESKNLVITVYGKLGNLIFLYRSPSQTIEEFETFVKNLELNLELIFNKNPYMSTDFGDFNAKSHYWYKGDKTTASVSELEIMGSNYGFTQIINEPTHKIEDSSSCIDLDFISQTNMVLDGGVHSSVHQNSHHWIVFAKLDLKVYYPPPYEMHVQHYKYANTACIKNALASFNWEQALFSDSFIDKKISVLREAIINVISNLFIYSQ